MSKHTPEPWYAYQREHPVGYSFGICNSRPCGTLVDEDGSLHTDFPDWNPGTSELVARTYDSENAHANANRIVACVNACAGMDDPAAEISRLRDELAAWKAEAEAWRQADDCDPMVRGECIREARERRAATDAIEKNAS